MSDKKNTYLEKLIQRLDSLELQESFSKKDYIKKNWLNYNYFTDRSFSVIFVYAKKALAPKKFKSISAQITRTQ